MITVHLMTNSNQSPEKIEDLPQTKKVRRKKVLAGKAHANIQALHLPLCMIHFCNLSKGFEIN